MPAPTLTQEITRLEAELADVRATLTKVRERQAYSTGEAGVAVTRVQYDKLVAHEETLAARLASLRRRAAGRGGIRLFRGVPSR